MRFLRDGVTWILRFPSSHRGPLIRIALLVVLALLAVTFIAAWVRGARA